MSHERKRWPEYQATYEEMIRETSTPEAPWFVVPADQKWFSRIVVAAALVQELEALDLQYPKIIGKALKELKKARKALKAKSSVTRVVGSGGSACAHNIPRSRAG